MKCKHRDALIHAWQPCGGCRHEAPYLARYQADAVICADCGYWLGLGEANDSDERVRVEKRAAMLSQPHGAFLLFSTTEFSGWLDHQRTVYPPEYADTLAGYLARCIATHDQEQEG